MKVRWYQEKEIRENWDSRWDQWNTYAVCTEPKLQYAVGLNNWIDVPLVVKEIDKRTHNSSN